jgi:redox-sensitive bicupin YhaK (pirin superfamily)
MITLRKSQERGHANRGWLDSHFTFSFADYHDPKHMGYRALRVINEDTIAPGKGFGAHAHRDMEIITYVLSGALQHRDSMGSKHIVGPNTIQAMSAGTGVVHSEFNASDQDPVHLLQIWITPWEEDVEPSYQQMSFEPEEKSGKLRRIAGPEHKEGSAFIHQDARVYVSKLAAGERIDYSMAPGRHAWLQVAEGNVVLNEQRLDQGDSAAVDGESSLAIEGAQQGGEFLLFDLA